jgi:hypothetical protein
MLRGKTGAWMCANAQCNFSIESFFKPPSEMPAKEVGAEREIFETWVRTEHPDHWPNPDSNGSLIYPDGTYRNKSMHERWQTWQAARVERGELLQRIEFAATALGVVERRRDCLRQQVDMLKGLIMESTRFTIVRACNPGDMVFLRLERDAQMEQVIRLRKYVEDISTATGIRIVIIDPGMSIVGRSEESGPVAPIAQCIYTPGEKGGQEFGTSCGNRWNLPVGMELYPFCAWCGKPVEEREVEPIPLTTLSDSGLMEAD